MAHEIKSFTGLRGLAALYVVVYHHDFLTLSHSPFKTFLDHGYLAVDLFFALSGFVMALTYRHLFAQGFTFASYRLFLGRRIARIYPLYLCITLVTLALYLLAPTHNIEAIPFDAPTIFTNLTMTQTWGFARSYVGPAWSISTECAAYVAFPLLAIYLLFGNRLVALVGTLLAVLVLFMLAYTLLPIEHTMGKPLDIWDGETAYPMLRCLADFTLGMVAFRAQSHARTMASITHPLAQYGLCAALVLLLFDKNNDFFVVLLLPLFILSVATDRGLLARLLSAPPFYFLGVISYSLYLVHVLAVGFRAPVHALIEGWGIPHSYSLSQFALLVAALPLACLTYAWIEKPGRSYMRSLLETRRATPAAPC